VVVREYHGNESEERRIVEEMRAEREKQGVTDDDKEGSS
jgi:hypothetical protein